MGSTPIVTIFFRWSGDAFFDHDQWSTHVDSARLRHVKTDALGLHPFEVGLLFLTGKDYILPGPRLRTLLRSLHILVATKSCAMKALLVNRLTCKSNVIQ